MNLIETIHNQPYSSINSNYKNVEGDIVDIGCLDWDWCNIFLGEKRVIGIDPQQNTIPKGAELFKGLIGPFDGLAKIEETGIGAKISDNKKGQWYDILSWKSFCKLYNIGKVCVLKINIEGGEYPLLASMDRIDFEKINQIAISFHDWLYPEQKQQKYMCLKLLQDNGFNLKQTYRQWGWWLAYKN